MSTKSDRTPRTDAHEVMHHGVHMVEAAHARNLERELNAARAELATANARIQTIKGAWDIDTADHCKRAASDHLTIERLRAELAALKAEPQPVSDEAKIREIVDHTNKAIAELSKSFFGKPADIDKTQKNCDNPTPKAHALPRVGLSLHKRGKNPLYQ